MRWPGSPAVGRDPRLRRDCRRNARSAPDAVVTDANDSGTERSADTGNPLRPDNPTTVIELDGAAEPTPSVRQDSTPPTGDMSTWLDQTATDAHPVTVRGWLQHGNAFENTFRIEWIRGSDGHTAAPSGYDHEARLHLAPTANNELADESLARPDSRGVLAR